MGNTPGLDPDLAAVAAALDVLVERVARRVVELSQADDGRPPATTTVTFSDELLSVKQVAAAMGVGKAKVYEYIRSGELPSFMVGNRRMFRRSDFDAFLRGLG